jgi:CBS domain-containing protein
VYGGEADTPDSWFWELAEMVTGGLSDAGFVESPPGILATQQVWRGPEGWWRERIDHWMSIDDTSVAATMAAAFDGRVVTGHLDVGTLFRDSVEHARLGTTFLDRLRRSIVEAEIPLGFLESSVTSGTGETAVLDIERAGIEPITSVARLFSLTAGITSVGTVRRLRDSAAAAVVEPEVAEGLEEALDLFRELRIEHQADQWTNGVQPDTLIRAEELGPLERRALRDAFRLVRDVQRSLDSGPLSALYPQ